MRRPIDPPINITTEFGVPDSNALFGKHSGIDYAVPIGTAIHATIDGDIVFAEFHPVRGNMVVLFDGSVYHRFMHNSAFRCNEGDRVHEGDIVALSGTTGLSTGPHCHWDINTRGIDAQSFDDFIDPAEWLKGNMGGQGMAYVTDEELADLRDWKTRATAPAVVLVDEAAYQDAVNWKSIAIEQLAPAVKKLQDQLAGSDNAKAAKILADMQAVIDKNK